MLDRDKFYFTIFCITFWVLGVLNFICEEIIPVIGESHREVTNSIVNVVYLVMGLFMFRSKHDLWLVVAYVFLGSLSSILNAVPTEMWIADMRRYLPILLCVPIIRYFFTSKYSEYFRKSLDKQLKIFLILQAFCLTEQFLRYGANDHGGGSLGNWNSGVISICIISISFYFVCKDWDGENYLKSLWRNRLYIFLLFPVLLNETKVSFVILAVYFVLLFPFNLRSVGKMIIAAPVMLMAAFLLLMVYVWAINSRDDVFSQSFLDNYLTGGSDATELIEDAQEAEDFIEELIKKEDQGEWMFLDIPRFMKISMLLPLMAETKGGYILGGGFGTLSDFTNTTEFVDNHIAAFFGTRMMIHYTFYPMGLLGLIWAFLWYKNILQFRYRSQPHSLRIKLMGLFIVLLVFFYNEHFNVKIGCIVFYIIMFMNTYKPDGELPEPYDKNEEPSPVDSNSGI